MKNTKKVWLVLAALVLSASFWTPQAGAVNKDELEVAKLSELNMAEYVASNNPVCLNMSYVGASTESVATITKTAFTAYAPAGTADSSNFGTSGGAYTLSASGYDTAGEFCTAVDGLDDYKCQLRGCKSNDNTTLLRDQTATSGTNNMSANGGFDVLLDTGGVAALTDVFVERIGITPKAGKRVILRKIVANANETGTLLIYGKLSKFEGSSDGVTRNDTTLVWSEATADDTDLSKDFSTQNGGGLEFAKDAHVVISAGNVAGVQAAANDLQVMWDER